MKKDIKRLTRRLIDLLPEHGSIDWRKHVAARWSRSTISAGFTAHQELDGVRLQDLFCIDDQKQIIQRNTEQFVRGYPANNVLLWGARGTGKSSLIHAVLNEYNDAGLRLIEVGRNQLVDLPLIARRLEGEPWQFILFCDDLSFEAEDASYKELKSALEGSVFKSSANMLIYATSNRRHLLPEYHSDNAAAVVTRGELHESEVVEEKISLSDRFGLWLSFYPFKQDEYLQVVEHWLAEYARKHGMLGRGTPLPMDESLRKEAVRWALARGVRSGRTAEHFARQWVGERLLLRDAEAAKVRSEGDERD